MKKLLFITLLVITSFVGSAQKKVSSYYNSYFEKEFNIEASEIKDGKFKVYIEVEAKTKGKTAMLSLESNEIKKFNEALTQMKAKYIEWSNVAKENNVTELNKEMEIILPKVTVCWLSSKWFFAFNERLVPRFIILNSGKHVLSMTKTVKSSSNEYIDETIYFVFMKVEDIDGLIAELDVDKLTKKLTDANQTKELFK